MKDSQIKWIYFAVIFAACTQIYVMLQVICALLLLALVFFIAFILVLVSYLIQKGWTGLVDNIIPKVVNISGRSLQR